MEHIPRVSIILVTWNNEEHLPRCLNILSKQTFQDFEIVLVDNGSNDNTVQKAKSSWPASSLTLELLRSNLGFAVANNIGARLAKGKWIALLNADAFPESDWLKNLLKTTEENPEYSFFSSRQVQENSPEHLDGIGDTYHISGLAWRNGYNYPSSKIGLEQKEVFSACAAAGLYLREEFINVSGFDEDYFSYFEDVDLSFRMRLAGKKCLYVPDAIVHHVGSVSTGKRSDFSVYHGYRNMIWTFFKNMPSPLIWFFLPLHVITIMFFSFYLTFRGQGKVILKAVTDALRGLPKILEKRKEIQKNIKINPFELLEVMSTGLLEPYQEFIKRNRMK